MLLKLRRHYRVSADSETVEVNKCWVWNT